MPLPGIHSATFRGSIYTLHLMEKQEYPVTSSKLYYPVGNTPPTDVTLGCRVSKQCDILLLGCGDIRNVLYTTHVLHQNGTFISSDHVLNFHLNDNESAIITRDLILLNIVKTVNPDDEADMQFLWSVWYDVLLSKEHLERLLGMVTTLTQHKSGNQNIYFGNEKTQDVSRNNLVAWSVETQSLRADEIVGMRTSFLKNRIKDNFPEKTAKDTASRLYIQCYQMLDDERLKDRYVQEVREYLEIGTTRCSTPSMSPKKILSSYCGNFTFILPDSKDWSVPEDSTPFLCYDVDQHLNKYDGAKTTISKISLNILKEWVRSFQAVTTRCSVQIYLWLDDAKTLCEKTLPRDLAFDFIDTSNLADEIGLIPLLVYCQGKLKEETGVLRTEMFYWHRCLEQGETVAQFLRKCIDVLPLMYPTVLGLHLAEELELGHEHIMGGASNEGCDKIELTWLKASDKFTPITVEELIYTRERGLKNTDAVTAFLDNIKATQTPQLTSEGIKTTMLDEVSKRKLTERLSQYITVHQGVHGNTEEHLRSQVVKEYNDRYEVEIKTTSDGEFTCTHDIGTLKKIKLQLASGTQTNFSTTLNFSCAISLEKSTINHSNKEGSLEATLIKDHGLTVGERMLPWRKLSADDVSSMQDYPLTDLGVNSLWLHHLWVYPREDMVRASDLDRHPIPGPAASSVHQLQDLFEILMIPDPDTNELMQKTYIPRENAVMADPIFQGYRFAVVVEGYKLWEHKPTLFVTVYNSDEAHRLMHSGNMTLLEMGQKLGLDGYGIENVLPQGFDLLEKILNTNSSRMTQDLSQEGRWETRSFLRMRYPFSTKRIHYKESQPVTKKYYGEVLKNDRATQVCLLRALEHWRESM